MAAGPRLDVESSKIEVRQHSVSDGTQAGKPFGSPAVQAQFGGEPTAGPVRRVLDAGFVVEGKSAGRHAVSQKGCTIWCTQVSSCPTLGRSCKPPKPDGSQPLALMQTCTSPPTSP